MFELVKENYFDGSALGNESTRDQSLIRLLKTLAIMAGSLKESKTRFLSSNPNKLSDVLKLILFEKQAGKNSKTNDEQIFAIADKLLESNCIHSKQHKFLLVKCLN